MELTGGAARASIEAFLFEPKTQATLQAALKELKEQFGSEVVVSQLYLQSIEEFPNIPDHNVEELRKYICLLKKGRSMSKVYPTLEILESRAFVRTLVAKLPDKLRESWVKMLLKEEKEKPLGLSAFLAFLEERLRVVQHPLCAGMRRGQCLHTVSTASSSPLTPGGDAAASHSRSPVSSGDSSPSLPLPTKLIGSCFKCNSVEHQTEDCPQFEQLSVEARRDFVYSQHLCFGCLLPGHQLIGCRAPCSKCTVCGGKHHTKLHNSQFAHANQGLEVSNCVTSVVPVVVSHPESNRSVVVYALLDSMSSLNFISSDVVTKLGVQGSPTDLTFQTMSGSASSPSVVVDHLAIRGLDEDTVLSLPPCYVRSHIPFDRSSIPSPEFISLYPHLSAVQVPPFVNGAPVGLLIGYKATEAFCPLKVATKDIHSPFAVKTPLGWCVMGSKEVTGKDEPDRDLNQGCLLTMSGPGPTEAVLDPLFHPPLPSVLEDHLPNFSEPKVKANSYSQEDLVFLRTMDSTMKQESDQHYCAPLPLKGTDNFPNNLFVAKRRLASLRHKLERCEGLKEEYCKAMSELIKLGFVEECPESGIPHRQWYLPHHAVVTSKTRIVFDCSVKVGGVSLNDRLMAGPDLLNSLLGILLRFRTGEFALSCDIKKMFLQFKVDPKDRDLLRFLWWREGASWEEAPTHYRMCVHLFGATSSPGVATYGLRRIARDHGGASQTAAVEFIRSSFYVDDGLIAVPTLAEAIQLFQDTKEILGKGGLVCHKVNSNAQACLDAFAKEVLDDKEDDEVKALGIAWNPSVDELSISLCGELERVSRRALLSALAKVYDPLGITSPFSLGGKAILQEMTRRRLDWDEIPPKEIVEAVSKWQGSIQEFSPVRLLRMASSSVPPDAQIHIFADASSVGYAAVAYLCVKDLSGSARVSFLLGKAKVAPLRPVLTIPRLELSAAVLAVSLSIVLKNELPVEECQFHFWTDSTIVLSYLSHPESRFKIFVANRVSFILSHSSVAMWAHIGSKENPADCGSRGVWSHMWIEGPEFLQQENSQDQTPSPEFEIDSQDPDFVCHAVHLVEEKEVVIPTSGTWLGSIRLLSWMLRFAYNSRALQPRTEGELSVGEMEAAKLKLVKLTQEQYFADELMCLRAGKPVKKASRLRKLDVFVDTDGVLRVGGRIKRSGLHPNTCHPVVLPGEADIVTLVVRHFHEQVHHQGRVFTTGEIRNQGYWILGLSQKVKGVIRKCVTCAKLRRKPLMQKMSELPEERTVSSPPFSYCGADAFGPFQVKQGRSLVKRWVIIFGCLYCRAVHLEAVHSLSTDSLVQAFRRLVCIRGPVNLLICDQGTNFVGSQKILTSMGCDLKFNPPGCSHRGGVYERLIGVSRRVMEGVLCEQREQLSDETFATVLAEVIWTVNCRPLSVESLHDPLGPRPLTANLLLTQKEYRPPVWDTQPIAAQEAKYARIQWKRVKYLSELFASRWEREVLLGLQERQKWSRESPDLKEDDVVLLVDENVHRSNWRLARVVALCPSKDGLLRTVRVQTANHSVYERAVQKLVFLFRPKEEGNAV